MESSHSTKSNSETAILIDSKSAKGKSTAAPAAITATTKATPYQKGGWKRGVAIFDFILRLCALIATLTATITMGTTDQTLPFFTQFFQFQASYDDLPAFTYFVVANAIASGYLVLSLPFSIVCIVRPHAAGARLVLLIFDTVISKKPLELTYLQLLGSQLTDCACIIPMLLQMLVAFTTAAAASAAAIVYLAHNGNQNANWLAICQQYTDFCQRVSGAVVASFIAAVTFVFLVVLSAVALRRR